MIGWIFSNFGSKNILNIVKDSIVKNKILCFGLSGLDIVYKIINDNVVVVRLIRVEILLCWFEFIFILRFKVCVILKIMSVFNKIIIVLGSVFLMILVKKLFLIWLLLYFKVIKNDGILMINIFIINKWFGFKGYSVLYFIKFLIIISKFKNNVKNVLVK